MTELMVLPGDKKSIEQVFIEGQDIDSTIAKIREEAKNLPLDMTVRVATINARSVRELAKQRRIAKENQAKIDRQAAEAKHIEDERLARESDKSHKAKINRQALADLVGHTDLTEDQAKQVIKCIAKGLISNVSTNY